MKKRQVDHVLRAAGRITGEKQFIIVGSQALHGGHPDLADSIVRSAEVDLLASRRIARNGWSRLAPIRLFTRSLAITPTL
jgi:hypothetical protein